MATPTRGGGPPGEGALTFDAIGKLMARQLAPLTSSVDLVRSDLDSFKSTISSSLNAFKGEVAEMRIKVNGVEGTAKEALAIANATRTDFGKLKLEMAQAETSAIDKRILEIEARLIHGVSGHGQDSTLVFGGFSDVTMFTAEEWVTTTLNKKALEPAAKTYHKGEAFRGIIFAEFSDSSVANCVLEALVKSKPTISGKEVWCKKDRPFETRVPMSLMLTLRRQLLD